MRRPGLYLIGTLVVVFGLFVATLVRGDRPVLGLDLQGGISVVLAPVGDCGDDCELDVAVDIIRNRVDSLGVAEPEISRQGDNIVIDLPGVRDRDKARRLVGKTAELQFRPVLQVLPPFEEEPEPTTTTTTTPGSTAPGETTTTTAPTTTTTAPPTTAEGETSDEAPEESRPCPAVEADADGQIPTTRQADQDRADCPVVLEGLEEDGTTLRYLLDSVPTNDAGEPVTGRIVDGASSSFVQGQGYVVDVDFTSDGGDEFVTYIAQPYVGQQVAIALDGVVQSAPTINQGITGDAVQISGSFSSGEAADLATILRFGALPVQLEEQTTQNISPTLGSDQLRAGVIAGLIGLALVFLYMLLYYRILGLVVILGLGLTGVVMWCLVCYLGQSIGLALTLAGVTGLIVSVGVTVDSYIVYFERLKDEVRSGKTVRSSVDRGFTSAFRTILAADIVSLIGAGVLYALAVGSVRGFALFLGLSTAVDLAVTYFFMHPLVVILARKRALLTLPYVGIGSGLDAKEATI